MERVLISAPGKVILFGEHSVVYQKTAIAASLGLRTYLCLEPRTDQRVHLLLPDIQVDITFSLNEIPSLDGQNVAVRAFVHLIHTLKITQGMTVCVRSFVPVGAGLGSSASYSVVIATALWMMTGGAHDLAKINDLAFLSEQVIHGNPSGVDNAIATYGGAKSFRRGQPFVHLAGSLRLLLTNTRVPRSTRELVAGVADKLAKYPAAVQPILDAMDAVAVRGQSAFQAEDIQTLEDLFLMNHALLEALGVSHPSLDQVRRITAKAGLKTKLTGAGGGGCAVTVVPQNVKLDQVMKELTQAGFDCYETSVGGPGVRVQRIDQEARWLLSADRDLLERCLN